MCETMFVNTNVDVKRPSMNSKSIFLVPTDREMSLETENIINKIELKSGEVDKINVKTLKLRPKNISKPIAHIINLCIENVTWPGTLKSADVLPIDRAKNRSYVSNYRPISLISNVAIIL